MMTVKEVSDKTGVSVRTLHYYDQIGLLHPQEVTAAGYRLYGNEELARLQDILFFKEMQFSLKQIREIIDNPNFNRKRALKQQLQILRMKKQHLEDLISFAVKVNENGGEIMDFTVFDTTQIEEFSKQAKELWGQTDAYKEYEEKTKNYSKDQFQNLGQYLMAIFKRFGELLNGGLPDSNPYGEKAQALVSELQEFITTNYYNCTKPILISLADMYSAEGQMKNNIDKVAGDGAADFAAKAIRIYCS